MRRLFAHRQLDEALRKSEARYRTVLDAAFDAIVTITPDGIVRWFNPGAERIFGYGAEEIIGQQVTLLMPERYRDLCVDGLHRYLRTGQARVVGGTTELVGLRKDGSEFPIEMSLGETYEDGERLFTGVIRDVTERKEVEKAFKESEERIRTLLQNTSDIITLLEADGTVRYVSPAVERVTGYRPEERIGTSAFGSVHPDDREQALNTFAEVLKEPGLHAPLEFRVPHKEGSWCYLEHVVNNLLDDPTVSGVVVTSRDVTQRKEAERKLREAEQRYRTLIEQGPAVVYIQEIGSPDSAIYMSPQIETLTGYSPEECKDPALRWGMVHPEEREWLQAEDGRTGEPGQIFTTEYRVVHRDGGTKWVHNESVLIEDEMSGTRYWQGFMLDITERKTFEEALERLSRQHEMVLKSAGEGIFGLDLDGNATFVNPAAVRITGWEAEELVGRRQHDLLHHTKPDGSPYPREECPIHAALEDGTIHSRDDEVFWRKDGTSFPVEYMSSPILQDGEVIGAVVTFKDITERKAVEQQLHHQAFHDSLTGLPNRALFMDRLERALTRANRRGNKVAVLFMDLDNFKVINDSLGHKAGDQLLVAVAERLETSLRSEDTAGRLGGDEFTILVEDISRVGEVVQIAERIADILRPPFVLEEQEVFTTVSTGLALNSTAQEQPADLLRYADLAMYRAKRRGKARYEVFEPSMDAGAVERLMLETGLRRALVRQEFRVYYQPILALENNKIAGVEALVRWEHPQRGLLLPEEFVSIAEETGLIVRIGQWVLREAGKQARIWRERYPGTPPLTISVNLSTREFFHPKLVAEVLDESDIDPASLQLEITEGSMTNNGTSWADRTLRNLKRMGVQLAIDDFGLGYSSLSYLKRFPVDFLKIDRSFIAGLGGEPNGVSKDAEIVKATIELTHALGLKVIAEGVETSEQLRRLRNMKCDFAQGNYFSEPLPSEELTVVLAEDHTGPRLA
jgi:diguanylate cyclase (GGDEF)-like protein/PAS domain S-box-containing protein